MKPFPHFHWISIEGVRPNIPENFIREELVSNEAHELVKEEADKLENKNIEKKSQKVQIPAIHNISKELQIFLENFEQRIRKEIKQIKLNNGLQYAMTKEMDISNNE